MAIPKQKEIEIPLLKVLIAAGGSLPVQEAINQVAVYFPGLTPHDLTIHQPSGRDLKWRNTVQWVWNTLADRGAIDRSIQSAWVGGATVRKGAGTPVKLHGCASPCRVCTRVARSQRPQVPDGVPLLPQAGG